MKFRILEITHNVNELNRENGRASVEYIIERKTIFGWREIVSKELDSKRIPHQTYELAEAYMMSNYMGHGVCKKNGNVYTYDNYTYAFC